MKFNVSSKTLYGHLSAVSKVINSKNALTVLNNFLFTLNDGTLTVKASDMENSLVATLDVTDHEGSGSFCLDARRLVDLLKEMPDQGMTFEINPDTLETCIMYSGGSYKTMGINGNEYPTPRTDEDSDEAISFHCTSDQALHGIERTLFAVGTDDLRPQMMGILWDVKPERIIFVSTDTRKLVKYTDGTSEPGVECSFILPMKPATVLKNLLSKGSDVKVTLTSRNVTFEAGAYVFSCRLIKGLFPDYNRVIPRNNPNVLTLDRQSLLNAVRRVTVFGSSGNGLIKFRLDGDVLRLEAQDNSYGTSGRERLSCSYEGDPLTIGFGAPYILEIFSTIPTPEVIIKLADASRPALCLPTENEENTDMLVLLMPMNLVD